MDQDPTDQNGQSGQNDLTNQTEATNINTVTPETPEASAASETNDVSVTPEAETSKTSEMPKASAEMTPAPDPTLLAALNEEPAPAPVQPLMMTSAKPTKTRSMRKTKQATTPEGGDDASATDTKKVDRKKAKAAKAKSTAKASGKKKSKIGLVIAIIIIVLLLLSIGGIVIWYFVYYNNPEVVAFDAVRQALSAENIGTHGEIAIDFSTSDSAAFDKLEGLTIELNTAANGIPNNTEANLKVDLKDAEDFTLSLGIVQMEDGLVYLRVSGIMDAIDSADLDKDLKKEISTALEFAEDIDGEWWEISVVDVLKSLDMDRESANHANKLYSCAVDAMQSDLSGEMAQIYADHRFIEIEKVSQVDTDGHWFTYEPSFGNSIYKVNLNKRELANFFNQIPETTVAEEYVDCYNAAMKDYMKSQGYASRYRSSYLIDTDDTEELSAYDIDIPDEMNFYIEVSDFGHKLNRFLMEYSDEDAPRISANLAFDYRKSLISAPNDYRPLTDLIDDDRLEDVYYELFMAIYYSGSNGSSYNTDDLQRYDL